MSKSKKDDDIIVLDIKQHIMSKSMWLGSKSLTEYGEWIYDVETAKFIKKKLTYSSALLKTFWELVCNAIDASIKNKEVKEIFITFDIETGMFSIYNDGGSIPIKFDEKFKVWVPELVATNPFSGSNLKVNKERRTGGTNGLGLKLCNIFSNKLFLECYDGQYGYAQSFEKRMDKISKPEIIKWDDLKKKDQYKRVYIEYYPCWSAFEYKIDENTGLPAKPHLRTIETLVRTIAYQTAAYVRKGITVKFNGEKLPINSLESYAKLFCEDIVSVSLKHPTDPWDLIIGIHDEGKLEHQSFVNGIYVRGGGDHIDAITDLLVAALKDRTQKILKVNKAVRFNRNMITNHLFIFQRGDVPDPEFDGQRKDTIRAPAKKFKDYELPTAFVTRVWNILKDNILATYAAKQQQDDGTKKRNKINIDGLRDADVVHKKGNSAEARLILSEGNSAESMVRRMLTDSTLGFKLYGTYNLRGVPMNIRKETRVVRKVKIRPKKWDNDTNRLKHLVTILGLDFTKTYEKPTDMQTLRYGGVIMAVDQDIDGVGNILSLTLNFIDLFWPALLKNGYVAQLATPLIRVYPVSRKDTIKEFYSSLSYEKWKKEEFNGEEPPSKKYKIKYYKGLSTHEKQEVKRIATTFHKHIIKFEGNEESSKLFEAFFGKLPNVRKIELAKPMKEYPEYEDKLSIPCTVHLMRDTKEFQNEKNYRNLACVTDGLNPSRRKILMGALDEFANSDKTMKVFMFGGSVAKNYQYHHGDMSLNGTITRMAQTFLGSNYLPLLFGAGEFGTRLQGGDDAGQSRYIEVGSNNKLVKILYPSEDRYILKYKFEDGERSEPQEWPSIIPMPLAETFEGIGTGWKQVSWARDIYSIIENVKRVIRGKPVKPMPPESFGFTGLFRLVDGIEYCVGMYDIKKQSANSKMDVIHIKELPIGVWTKYYLNWLREKREEYIQDITENCGVNVSITIVLKKGMLEVINKEFGSENFTPIEECFGLYRSMQPFLNFTDGDGCVHEYKTYEQIFMVWYDVRKELYELRLRCLSIMTKLRIKFLENIIRFTDEYKTMNISNKSEEDVLKVIEKNKFDKFIKSPIEDPKYVPEDMLEKTYIGEGATYDYLVNLSTRSMYTQEKEKRINELKEYKTLLEDINNNEGMFIGAKWWLRELDELKKVIEEGRKTDWTYGKKTYNWE